MKITGSPVLEKFSRYFDVPIDEVVEWVNIYVNRPQDMLNQEQWIEPAEEERLVSIREYVRWRVDTSINERIRRAIKSAITGANE